MKSKSQKKRSILTISLKTVLVAGLLYFLFQKGFISLHDTKKAFTRLDKILPALAALVITMFLGVVRWQWLLRAQGIQIEFRRVLQLTLIGNFFNIALPGAVSGDFVKAFYIGREIQGYRARAFGSILFDRVSGLSALALVSASALLFGIESFRGTALFAALRVFISLAALAVIFFYGYLFLVREHHDPMLRVLRALETKYPRMGSLTRIYEGIRHYHHHRWTVLKVLVLSIAVHLTVGWACLSFAQALGDTNIGLLSVYVLVPLGLLVTAIPVLPAGVGTGHAAFLFLFHLIGSQRGADVFTIFALTNIAMGALGGLVYLRFRTNAPELVLPTA